MQEDNYKNPRDTFFKEVENLKHPNEEEGVLCIQARVLGRCLDVSDDYVPVLCQQVFG